MKVIIGGGSGFIGKVLAKDLIAAGHEVIIISRKKKKDNISWKELEKEGLPACDVVVNLAGKNIFMNRWTAKNKELITFSRINTTTSLKNAIEKMEKPPALWISISAVGWYPGVSPKTFTEYDQTHGEDFVGNLCHQWEKSAEIDGRGITRSLILRLGLVLGQTGGGFKKMLPIFKMGLGAILGTGHQLFAWIHIQDLINFIKYSFDNKTVEGIYNLVSPQSITNEEFSLSLARHVKRPLWFKVPFFFLHLLLGERAKLLVARPKILPKRVQETGFSYSYTAIDVALDQLVK